MKNTFPWGVKLVMVVSLIALVLLAACGPSQADLDATATKVMADEFAEQTAEAPTPTQVPTDTQTSTDTPNPTPTITKTPRPTLTPKPTIPPVPTFGSIKFYPDDFSAPMEEFPYGTTKVHACFEYWRMSPDERISGYMYFNGKEVDNISITLDLEGNGNTCFTIFGGRSGMQALAIGTHKLTLYIGRELAQSASFKVTRAERISQDDESVVEECSDPIGCVEIAPDEPVHIAAMLTISGATAFLGEDSQGGVEIAIDDRGGTLLDHDILFTVEDSGCSAEGGQTAATKVASDPTIVGVIGTNCSSSMTASMNTISFAGLSILSPSNTAPALTFHNLTGKPGYYRVSHTDIYQGYVAAEFAFTELGARTASTIHDGSPYADQLQQVFATRFVELGGTVPFQGAVNVGDTDMRTILTTVASDSPDILYFPIFEPEGPFIVAQSSEIAGLEETTLVGADGLLVDSYPENAGPNAIGSYLSGPYVSGEPYDEFLAKWEAKFGGVPPSGFHAFAYDGANILMDAIEEVAVMADDGTILVPRQALRDALSKTSGFQGLTGLLDCGETNFGVFGISKGDCATGESIGIFQITEAEVNKGNWPPQVVYTGKKVFD